MTWKEVLDQAFAMLQRRSRVTYCPAVHVQPYSFVARRYHCLHP